MERNEKELAIQMWQEIKEQIKKGKLNNNQEVHRFKSSFTEKHNLDWGIVHGYLCDRFNLCKNCPIVSTKETSEKYFTTLDDFQHCVYYYVASNQTRNARKELLVSPSPRSKKFKTEIRLEACDRIIEGIKSIKED